MLLPSLRESFGSIKYSIGENDLAGKSLKKLSSRSCFVVRMSRPPNARFVWTRFFAKSLCGVTIISYPPSPAASCQTFRFVGLPSLRGHLYFRYRYWPKLVVTGVLYSARQGSQ